MRKSQIKEKVVFLQKRTRNAKDGDKSHRIQTGTDARA